MTPDEIVTVDDREVRVYGEVMCTWLARAEALNYAEDLRRLIGRALDDEREACAVASETWTEGRSRFITAADAIRARKPLK